MRSSFIVPSPLVEEGKFIQRTKIRRRFASSILKSLDILEGELLRFISVNGDCPYLPQIASSTVRLLRHCRTKREETDRLVLNHYASPLLYPEPV